MPNGIIFFVQVLIAFAPTVFKPEGETGQSGGQGSGDVAAPRIDAGAWRWIEDGRRSCVDGGCSGGDGSFHVGSVGGVAASADAVAVLGGVCAADADEGSALVSGGDAANDGSLRIAEVG
eukprot:CCRYP_016012-RA/>CCRYP_016012-RA protein AED:0.46 eAED:1.00 QI:0/-1/0/1/-1/1/1/0/119